MVDYLTNYWEIEYLQENTTSITVAKKIKSQCAHHSVPITVFTDNGHSSHPMSSKHLLSLGDLTTKLPVHYILKPMAKLKGLYILQKAL